VAASTVTIHLLITDLVMPETDGLELTRRFRAVYPKTPVLMVSGSLPLLPARSEPDLERFDFLASHSGSMTCSERCASYWTTRAFPDTKTVVLRLAWRMMPRHRAFAWYD